MPRRKSERLTPLELEIMQVLWETGPATVQTVQRELKRDLAYTTVQTMLSVLLRKKKVTQVIVMDLLPVHEELAQFVNAGVAGFILKDATFEDFVGTIRSVADGARVLPPRMTGTLFSQIVQAAIRRGSAEALEAVRMTQREREVIALIAEGLSNKDIAKRLAIATDTVKSHVRNIMDKLALHSRLQIAAYVHNLDD